MELQINRKGRLLSRTSLRVRSVRHFCLIVMLATTVCAGALGTHHLRVIAKAPLGNLIKPTYSSTNQIDCTPTVTLTDITVSEPNGFLIYRNYRLGTIFEPPSGPCFPSSPPYSFDYKITDGTATVIQDYLPNPNSAGTEPVMSGTLTDRFTTVNSGVQLNFWLYPDGFGRDVDNVDETFFVDILNPVGIRIINSRAKITIKDSIGCRVPTLQPITDPVAQSFEEGNSINTTDLKPELRAALTCFRGAVESAGGNTSNFVNSGFRPTAYQNHLRDVYDRWQELKNETSLGCAQLKAEVKQEFIKHKLLDTQRPAAGKGLHTTGDAVDVNIKTLGLSTSQVVQLAEGCNLFRPHSATDPVHFILKNVTPQSPLFEGSLAYEWPTSASAVAPVRVKVFQENLGGRVFYRYTIINGGDRPIVGLKVGIAHLGGDSELTVAPSGWDYFDGLPLNAAEAPAGWDAYVATTEESELVHVAWDVNQLSASVPPGQTRRGFNVVLPQGSAPYLSGHWTAILDDGTAVSASLEPETASAFNPIDGAQTFVTQHYDDFLNRSPDPSGLAFWTNDITSCGTNPQCIEVKRINVSAAFFLSIEFQETGYLVYRMYKAAYGDTTSPGVTSTVPIIRLEEFLPDTQKIGQGVQVNVGNWQQQLESNKNTFALEFVQRPRFMAAYPASITAAEFVDRLNQRAGGVISAGERIQLINELAANNTAGGRASVLSKVAEDADLRVAEFNRAFVLMQYYGYLRRNPDDAPDTDFSGWKFWLNKLNEFNGNFANAEMVKGFITSIEYRQRFGH